jgi:hypothetical protein
METKKLESIYQQKIKDLEELKKSILQRAFSGGLSESGFTGLQDEQDLNSNNKKKILKSSHPSNPDSDNLSDEQDLKSNNKKKILKSSHPANPDSDNLSDEQDFKSNNKKKTY